MEILGFRIEWGLAGAGSSKKASVVEGKHAHTHWGGGAQALSHVQMS